MYLNNAQLKAVHTTEGPVRIIAGPGTGKTHTLVARILHLIVQQAVTPAKILVLTFSNRAAHEIFERLREKSQQSVRIYTFHSLSAALLRKFWRHDFKILNEKDKIEVVRSFLQDDEKNQLQQIISEIDKVMHFNEEQRFNFLPESAARHRFYKIVRDYERYLDEKAALDFNLLLIRLLNLWEKSPDILLQCQRLFHYVMVDEYQDVNELQITLMRLLVNSHRNICVVGDPDQTIYSWRGSNPRSMQEFCEIYPNTESIVLEENYRNPPAVLNAAQRLIVHGRARIEKNLVAKSALDAQVSLWVSNNEWEQREIMGHILQKYFGGHEGMHDADLHDRECEFSHSFKDVAVIYRTRQEGKAVAADLKKRGFPFQISSGENFWEETSVKKFLEELHSLEEIGRFPTEISFSEWFRIRLAEYVKRLGFGPAKEQLLYSLLPYSMDFDYLPVHEGLHLFLDMAEMNQETDNVLPADKISLLTFHAAKGLEFPVVIISGLEEGVIPHRRYLEDRQMMEEERRLLYVGMTRARGELHLVYNKKFGDDLFEPSRFLEEIGEEAVVRTFLPQERAKSVGKKVMKKAQMRLL